jgi:hypothetical protein
MSSHTFVTQIVSGVTCHFPSQLSIAAAALLTSCMPVSTVPLLLQADTALRTVALTLIGCGIIIYLLVVIVGSSSSLFCCCVMLCAAHCLQQLRIYTVLLQHSGYCDECLYDCEG